MEDVTLCVADCEGWGVFGMFDGHGGVEPAEYASERLPVVVMGFMRDRPMDEAIVAGFARIQGEMVPWCRRMGTTATLAWLRGRRLVVAWVGDSQLVLQGGAVVAVPHRPHDHDEFEWLFNRGGSVIDNRVEGVLAVSRALGNGVIASYVNATPAIRDVALPAGVDFFIIASDGLWDVITPEQASEIAEQYLMHDAVHAAAELRDRAYSCNSDDNISVIVVDCRCE